MSEQPRFTAYADDAPLAESPIALGHGAVPPAAPDADAPGTHDGYLRPFANARLDSRQELTAPREPLQKSWSAPLEARRSNRNTATSMTRRKVAIAAISVLGIITSIALGFVLYLTLHC